METINFLVQKSSSVGSYEVTFFYDGNNMNALCNCQAGQNGQICKHRTDILNGDYSKIISDNKLDVKIVLEKFKGTPLEIKLIQLNALDKEKELITKKIETTRKEVIKIMRGQ